MKGICWLGVLLASGVAGGLAPGGTDEPRGGSGDGLAPGFLLPGPRGMLRLRLDLTVDGTTPFARWNAFLDRFFNHFDRNADGSLSREETARVMPLPLSGGRELILAFDRMDVDRDGKGSRAELKAFCLRYGYTPVVSTVIAPSVEDARFAGLFLRRLDQDGDGKWTVRELRKAFEALGRYDTNDDERLERAELLAGAEETAAAGRSLASVAGGSRRADLALRIDLDRKGHPRLTVKGGLVRLVRGALEGGHRLQGPEGRWWITVPTRGAAPNLQSTRAFLTAQLREALAGRSGLPKADLEEDAALTGLRDLFPFADRNGDDRLTLAELDSYLDLVEGGLRAQVWVTLSDRHGNLFPFLDRNGDGQLSLSELSAAPDVLGGQMEGIALPRQFELSFGGPTVRSWGGVAVPGPVPGVVKVNGRPAGPAWFRAMDRNADGVLSRREFLGPPAVFRRLDENDDGMISASEAARANVAKPSGR